MSEEKSLERKFVSFSSILLLHDLASALKLGSRIVWTASIYYFKFIRAHGYKNHDQGILTTACLFLASKVEERRVCIKNLSKIFSNLLYHQELDTTYIEKELLIMERIILNTIQYDLQVSHTEATLKEIFSLLCQYNEENKSKVINNEKLDKNEHESENEEELLEKNYIHLERITLSLLNDSYKDFICIDYSNDELALSLFLLAISLFPSIDFQPLSSSDSPSSSSITPLSSPSSIFPPDKIEYIINKLEFKNINSETIKEICDRMLTLYDDYKKFERSIQSVNEKSNSSLNETPV